MRALFFLPVLVLLFANACKSKQKYTSRPSKGTTTTENQNIEVNVMAFHDNELNSTVYLKVLNENLLYKRPDTSASFYAHLRIAYQVMLEGNIHKMVDSSSFELLDRAGTEHVAIKSLFAEFPINASYGNNYLLTVSVLDMNRRVRYHKDQVIHKTNKLSAQNFLVLANDSIAFRHNFHKNQTLKIRYADSTMNSVRVDCFLREFGPAPPPFSIKEPDPLKYKPDSTFVAEAEKGFFSLTLPPVGFYHVKVSPELDEGLSLYVFDENFPGVSSSDEMINCARYIMTKEEFEKCKTAADPKKAIDDFWLNIGGSNERARELLKRYYGRVLDANRQFSSYTQGWKSDRGMIYVIFGQPINIYKSKKDEIWVYGNEANPASLRFVFNKTENPFSDNDYIMERSQFYKEPWHTAVDFWRQGHVYIDTKR